MTTLLPVLGNTVHLGKASAGTPEHSSVTYILATLMGVSLMASSFVSKPKVSKIFLKFFEISVILSVSLIVL